ncbi:MAG: efflux RND transporter periplasmic adaptor subunit [Bacteroidota bacterium]
MKLLKVLIVLTLFCISCNENTKTVEKEIRPVKYAKIGESTGLESYTFSGAVIAKNEVALSFKVTGTLNQLNVALGDKVKKGQLIATVDPTDYTLQSEQAVSQKEGAVANRESAEANLKSSETQLISAQASYDRIAKLYENNSVSLNEYQQSKAGLDAAKAQYDASKSQLDAAISSVTTADQQLQAANNQVGYTRVYAPIDGVITDVAVDANEMVSAGAVIAVVSSTGQMLVEVGVPEILINRLVKGQKAVIKLPSLPEQQFDAEIVEVAFASGTTTTYPVKLKIVDPIQDIRPGMATEVGFKIDNTQTITTDFTMAPIKAVASGTEGNYVFKLIPDEEDGQYIVKKASVQLGNITDNGYIIKEGVNRGDLIAIAGLNALYDGKVVKLLEK